LASKGYRLISISLYGDPSGARYAAVWVQRPGPAWQAFHGRNAGQYQQFVDDWEGKGYYPVLIAATGSGSDAIFAGMFEHGSVGWKARHGIKRAEFEAECTSAYANSQIPVSVAIYGDDDGNRRYAAIWHTNTQKDRWNYHDLDSGTSYQTWFTAATEPPMRHMWLCRPIISTCRSSAMMAWDPGRRVTD
jgi:hypothetical protein